MIWTIPRIDHHQERAKLEKYQGHRHTYIHPAFQFQSIMTTIKTMTDRTDIWMLIGLHLKPRHLAKFMQTCKTVKKAVDNENYWMRVVAHLFWRDEEHNTEVYSGCIPELPTRVFPKIEHNLYHMLGLEHGYYWGMQRFFQRLDEVIIHYKDNSKTEKACKWWAVLQDMSLKEKTLAFVKEDAMKWRLFGLSLSDSHDSDPTSSFSMKELAKRNTISTSTNPSQKIDKIMIKFLCEMEDDPMPPKYKRHIFRKLNDMLYQVFDEAASSAASGMGSEDARVCPTEIASGICKF